ncbi:MAG: DNA repair protein RecO [Chitinispirillaceae bacterium]|jgi:DNA repair protein RecO (recombination protein O)
MSIEKAVHLVLSVMPYRETSKIATLLSKRFGRVSGIAKGVRRSPHAPLTLERGQIVELVLYVKPHRDLHTIGAISVVNYFPSIRADIGKLALRDTCFELMLKSSTASESHGELFDFAEAFLTRLETLPPSPPLPVHELWAFFHGWAKLSGFLLNVRECVRCGHPRVSSEGGLLVMNRGGLVCSVCGGPGIDKTPSFLPGRATSYLLGAEPDVPADTLAPGEQMRISRTLADYCRYHLDIRSEFKSLPFLESVLESTLENTLSSTLFT